ncbi:hypothetical protein NBRC10512_002795 [Rhodotorula toruloides]|uniref:RHTO0S11e04258g1_1 n=2 Tax=Rhodotorula toruloides TaxID=5286 RepID=A0A061BD10_RHOTO|nr:GATA-binding transcription factor [Rhodotorula toruloides NP11]EMS21615.1 GATA-binding transcription factor [Rhodotorula toruloides NP11]CDR45755.1 RHTO0S11e04258g1_1 [Rhodotorula toruloides]
MASETTQSFHLPSLAQVSSAPLSSSLPPPSALDPTHDVSTFFSNTGAPSSSMNPHPGHGLPFPPLIPPASNGYGHPAPFPSYPPTPYSAYPTPGTMHALPPAHASAALPGIGQVRCYWTILSSKLEYAYLDPVLDTHLGAWKDKFVGTSVLDWVHPDERDQLAEDLLPKEDTVAGVESTGVFGSVTRCRYSRLTRIMRELGCPHPPSPPDAALYAIDDDYLNLEVTTSWIAGDRKGKGKEGLPNGAVLAFWHVATDKDPAHDSDPQHRTEWSNWCGASLDYGPYLTPQQCDDLLAALTRLTSPSSSSSVDSPASADDHKGALSSVLNEDGTRSDEKGASGPPPHVFQILDHAGRPIITFPQSEGTGEEGRKRRAYDAERFSALAREVMARPREAAQSRTSCTRRYRSKHPVMRDGTLTTIESVVIMYGAITFACFQTGGVYLSSARKAGLSLVTSGDLTGSNASAHDFALEDVPHTPTVGGPAANGKRSSLDGRFEGSNGLDQSQPNKRFKADADGPPVLPRLQTVAASPAAEPESPHEQSHSHLNGLSISTSGRSFRQNLDVDTITAGGISPTVASASAILGSLGDAPVHHSPPLHGPGPAQTSYAAFYNSHPFEQHHPAHGYPTASAGYAQYSPHPLSQSHSGYFPPAPQSPHEPASAHNGRGLYPPPGQPVYDLPQPNVQPSASPTPSPTTHTISQTDFDTFAQSIPVPPAPANSSGKKPPKQRPDGPVFKPNPKACESCGTVNSPEWRKGPTGAKTLCNACGLRYARSVARAKKQAEIAANGGVAPKKGKKKGKAAAVASAVTGDDAPQASGSTPYSQEASPMPGSQYDLVSAYTRGPSHPTPKPYTPYHTTAPGMPGQYSHVGSPTVAHAPQYPSPSLPPPSTNSYFPSSMPYSAAGGYSAATAPMPVPTHSPLPPVSHGGFDYSRAPSHSPFPYPQMSSAGTLSPHIPPPIHSPNPGAYPSHSAPTHSPHMHALSPYPPQHYGWPGQQQQQQHHLSSQQQQPQQHQQHENEEPQRGGDP